MLWFKHAHTHHRGQETMVWVLSNFYFFWASLFTCSVQFSSITQLCPSLCDPMDCTTRGLTFHHQLPEFTPTHVHWVGNTINHLILCFPLLLPPSIFLSIRVFSNESVLRIRWPKYWSFRFSISPSDEYSGLISFRMYWLALLLSKGLSRVFSNTTVQKHQFFSAQLSL